MKPLLKELQTLCPDIGEPLISNHLDRLDERYFNRFDPVTIAQHIRMISNLNNKNLIEIDIRPIANERIACTICSFDYPAVFSLLTGVMGSMGFSILTGGVHTYEKIKKEASSTKVKKRQSYRTIKIDPLERKKIVDHFEGSLDTKDSLREWIKKVNEQLVTIITLLETGKEEEVGKAKHLVNEKVANHLSQVDGEQSPGLLPVEIWIDNQQGDFTRIKVVSEDTPVFLYAFSNALSLHNLSIEHVKIVTENNRVADIIDFVDRQGCKIEDPLILDQVKLSVLLTKQFTYFLNQAPDPFAALSRFEFLVDEIVKKPKHGEWTDFLSSPKMMQDLAKLLGASDYLWEDMIRQQYETLLPMISPHVGGRDLMESVATLPDRLEVALEECKTYADQQKALNEFKDREIFLFDLDHILTSQSDFKKLSEHLTFLADVIFKKTMSIIYNHLVSKYGYPRTVAGIETKYSVLGLGKMGGAALGYASDLELMFVYSDNGRTDGENSLDNTEFFDLLVKETTKFIRAKREGIFNIDLRLRPFGSDGPLASSLELFCDYYGQGGSAHAVEKLALVRLRPIAGDPELGARLERLRDDFIYATKDINLKDLREFRLKQFEDKVKGDQINAKFSPGALVDLEYDVQILQIIYGHDYPQLRTPRIHQALNGLHEVGVLDEKEAEALKLAYGFLRHLINGLRMLRGSAKDLFLPPAASLEFTHLARRLGYIEKDGLDPSKQLFLDFETHTAAVRAFVEKHFGRASLPGKSSGNVADLILSEGLAMEDRLAILQEAGFKNPERADVNLRNLAGDKVQRAKMAKLVVLAVDSLKRKADPDMALNNWEHFVSVLDDPASHFEEMLGQPMRLDMLLDIFSTSQFLAASLARHPEYLEWATNRETLHQVRNKQEYEKDLSELGKVYTVETEWLDALRLYRRREFLRIGTRDICLKSSMRKITLEISNLADALVNKTLERVWTEFQLAGKLSPESWEKPENHFCLLAFGKLGGHELNYSSDIDLVAIYDDGFLSPSDGTAHSEAADLYSEVTEGLRSALTQYTQQGYIYRVDFRLRPYGIGGQLVSSLSSLVDYYNNHAVLSEIQALLKMRPIAGNLALGDRFLETAKPLLLQSFEKEKIIASIEHMRNEALKRIYKRSVPVMDVKSGMGGIRDIEFLVQGLQLIHAKDHPRILQGHTLEAMDALLEEGLLDRVAFTKLSEDYVYLRRLEHFLQIFEDQQIHTLPKDKQALTALAKRNLGPDSNADSFMQDLEVRLHRVRAYYEQLLKKS